MMLAHYGLGQLYMQRGDYKEATASLERVAAHSPGCDDVLKALASLWVWYGMVWYGMVWYGMVYYFEVAM